MEFLNCKTIEILREEKKNELVEKSEKINLIESLVLEKQASESRVGRIKPPCCLETLKNSGVFRIVRISLCSSLSSSLFFCGPEIKRRKVNMKSCSMLAYVATRTAFGIYLAENIHEQNIPMANSLSKI